MHVFDIYNNEIAYYTTPKCGSRTILAWAALIKESNLLNEHPEWFEESRVGVEYKEIRKRVKKLELPTHNQKIRFCVVRDPVDRFVSGFTNRILFHRKPNVSITIEEFIANIDTLLKDELFKDAKMHFTTQTHYIGKNPNLFTHIFNIKELTKVKELFENYLNITLPDLHLQKNGRLQKPQLTEQQIQWIKNRYRIDYQIYGQWLK